MTRPTREERADRPSLFSLITLLPAQLIALARAEIDNIKHELLGKLKHLGFGLVLIVMAMFFAFILLAVLVTAAIAGLATALPVWASALIVAGVVLLLLVACVYFGVKHLQNGVPVPDQSFDSIEADFRSMSEAGNYGKEF